VPTTLIWIRNPSLLFMIKGISNIWWWLIWMDSDGIRYCSLNSGMASIIPQTKYALNIFVLIHYNYL
jgi:hypothetical protein